MTQSNRRRFRAGTEPLEGRQLLAVSIGEVVLPGAPAERGPLDVTAGPDGNIWYTRQSFQPGAPGRIGRVTPDGTVTEFPVPGDGLAESITAGPDGSLWFVDSVVFAHIGFPPVLMSPMTSGAPAAVSQSYIGRITTDGVITQFPVPQDAGVAQGITAGPDGNLWFTGANGINRMTTAGVITEFVLPSQGQPQGITTGPDGNLWFTEYGNNHVGRITPDGAITEFALPAPNVGYSGQGITTGPDGNLWFLAGYNVLTGAGRLDRITPAGVVTEFTLPRQGSDLAAGSDGALWIAGYGNTVIRFALDGHVDEYPVPTFGGMPSAITAAPDGTLWFSEYAPDRLGRIFPTAAADPSLAVTASPFAATETQSFTGTVATFTDAHQGTAAGDFLAQINWGDGSTTQGSIVADGSGAFHVTGGHSYFRRGSYSVSIQVFDTQIDAPRQASASMAVSVASAPLVPVPVDTLAFRGQENPILVGIANGATSNHTYTATIEWGDGTTSAGVVETNPFLPVLNTSASLADSASARPSFLVGSFFEQLKVYGNHVYAGEGWYIVRTHIRDEDGNETVVTSQVQFRTPEIYDKHTVNVEARPGVPTGDVTLGYFYTNAPSLPANLFSATVDWGDGTQPTDATITYVGFSTFRVSGSHQYAKAGDYTFHVTILAPSTAPIGALFTIRRGVFMDGAAHVEAPPLAIHGRLDPGSDTGLSHSDGITAAPRPTFTGTATPGATVQLFARRNGNGTRFQIAQGVADAHGHWVLTSSNLPDGAYAISAHVSTADGRRASSSVLLGGKARLLVVDTTGPTIKNLVLDSGKGRIRVDFNVQERLDPRGAGVATRYALERLSNSGATPLAATRVSLANRGRTVVVDLGSPVADGRYALRIVAAGVRDLAGNALDGEFGGSFATGNGQSGGDFLGLFTVMGNHPTLPTPLNPANHDATAQALAALSFEPKRRPGR